MERHYVTVDVFTEQMFRGNPVAVVLDAEGLSAGQMQAIAVEFNYSETTFILPPKDQKHSAWVRIFTPSSRAVRCPSRATQMSGPPLQWQG
jgi:trans-2,3-dihydro-3-hydroxyanthranilate isomerase